MSGGEDGGMRDKDDVVVTAAVTADPFVVAPTDPKYLTKVSNVCPRCGMKFRAPSEYKRHLACKRPCKPNVADVSLADEIERYLGGTDGKAAMQAKVSKAKAPKAKAPDEENGGSQQRVDVDDEAAVKPKKTPAMPRAKKVPEKLHEGLAALLPPSPSLAGSREDDAGGGPIDNAHVRQLVERVEVLEGLMRRLIAPSNLRHTSVFGFETTYHVDAAFVKRYVDVPLQCLVKVATEVFFNKNMPENSTVRYFDGKYHVLRKDGWFAMERGELIARVAQRAISVIDCVVGKSGLPEELSEFMAAVDNRDPDVLMEVTNELENLIFFGSSCVNSPAAASASETLTPTATATPTETLTPTQTETLTPTPTSTPTPTLTRD